MKRAGHSPDLAEPPGKRVKPFPFDIENRELTHRMLAILDKLESGATFHVEDNTIFRTFARVPVHYGTYYKEACKEHWLRRRSTMECMLLRTKRGFDADLVFDALSEKLPPGIHCCRALRRKLLHDVATESLQAQHRLYAATHYAMDTAPDFPLPDYDPNPMVLDARMARHLQRLAKHATDDSFRLMYVDVLLHVLKFLVDLPQRQLTELRTLSCVSKVCQATVQVFVRKDLARLKIEYRFRTLFGGRNPTKTDLLSRCPFFKPHLTELVSYAITSMYGPGQAYPLMALSQSFVDIFGDRAAVLLAKLENAPRLRLQREEEFARRALVLRQEAERLQLKFDINDPQVKKYCRGRLKTTKFALLSLSPE